MIGRLRTMGHILALSYRADPRSSVVLILLIALMASTPALIATSLRWLVEASNAGLTVAIAAAAAASAVAISFEHAIGRMQANLQDDMGRKMDVALQERMLRSVAAPHTLSHFGEPDYLDKVSALREGLFPLANYTFKAVETATAVVSLVVSLVLLVEVTPLLGLLAAAAAIPLVTSSRGQRLVERSNLQIAQELRHERLLHDLAVDSASLKELRVSGSADELDRHGRRLWDLAARTRARAQWAAFLWSGLGWTVFAAGIAGALLVVGASAVVPGSNAGALVLVITLASRLKWQISETLHGFTRLSVGAHLGDRFFDVERRGAAAAAGRGAAPTRVERDIRLAGVGFQYPGERGAALENVDLVLPAGSTVAIVGENGSGKSTLVNLLLGLHEPTAGRISVDGIDLRSMDPAQWKGRTSAAFQDFAKLYFTLDEVVGLGDVGRMHDRRAVQAAIDRAQAGRIAAALADGLDTQLGERFGGRELSQGQWQKIALARGLLRDAPLVLALDEPTSALDPQAEHDLFSLFVKESRRLAEATGTISLLVSHRFSSAHLADHIVVLRHGTVVEQGTHPDLLARNGEYRRFFDLQRLAYEG